MTPEIEQRLFFLRLRIEDALNRLHDELLSELRRMAKSTGQRTRTDRLLK